MKIQIDGIDVPFRTWTFPGGEVQVRVAEDYRDLEVLTARIEANITSSADLMAVLMATDAVRRKFGEAVPITLCCPYLPYARQDRVCAPGEALGVKVLCDILNAQRYHAVEVWDCHSDVGLALLERVHHREAHEFLKRAKLHVDTCLVAPDRGAIKRVGACARVLGLPMFHADKVRDPKTGAITNTEVHGTFDHRDWLLMVDDICDGGRTFFELAKVLREKGAKEVGLYVTHGIFSQGFNTLAAVIDRIYVANSFVADAELPPFVTKL